MLLLALAKIEPPSPRALAWLSVDERERARRMRAPGRRNEFLCGRVLARLLLERMTGATAASHRLELTANGKPFRAAGPAFSISHSGSLVACAATDSGEIGVDIEFPDALRDTAQLAQSAFSPAESQWLRQEPADRFYQLWTLKEAWQKATGTGIAGGLNQLQARIRPPAIEISAAAPGRCKLGLYEALGAILALATMDASHDSATWLEASLKNGTLSRSPAPDFIASGALTGPASAAASVRIGARQEAGH